MTLEELRARIAEIDDELRTIHTEAGDAALADEQQTRWDELETEREQRQAEAASMERRHAAIHRAAQNPRHTESGDGAALEAPEVMRRVEPFDGSDVRSLPRPEARDKALKALDMDDVAGHLQDTQRSRLSWVMRRLSRNTDGGMIARRLLLTESEAYRNAFVKMTTRTSPVLTPEEQRAMEAFDEFRAMSIGTDSAGGFGVPVLIDPTIILDAQGSPNDILAMARVEVITNDEWKGVSSAGVSWSFDAEATGVSDDSPSLAQPNVPVHKAQGFIPYSIEVGMDYPNFAAEMSMLLREGYSELVAEALTTGSGSDEPTGVVTALDANTNSEVTVATAGALAASDIYSLWDALPIKYRNRGERVAWMSSTDIQNEVRQLGTADGHQFTVNLTQEALPMLFGRRYPLNDFMDDMPSGTGTESLLVVGDWQNYLVAQRAGMSVELVPHLLDATTNRPTGERGWYAWARVGGNSINDKGFRLLKNSAT